MRPFGCPVTILNTIDHLGKFDRKADEGFFVGYSTNSKAFRVFNSRTRIVEENMHVKFSEDTPNIAGSGPNWLFDIDALTKSMNYKPVVAENQSNGNPDTKACDDAGSAKKYDINGSSVKTPMVPPNKLGPDLNGKSVNKTQYRDMIGSLMYLTTSRPDIQFSTCLYARYQANHKESHLIAVKRISRYLKGTPSLGLWCPKYLGFDLKGYSDSDYVGCIMDRKSTSGSCQLLGGKLVC
ncbi:ribonuclease H-like domain-containing protein [Tanacetum coccineum]